MKHHHLQWRDCWQQKLLTVLLCLSSTSVSRSEYAYSVTDLGYAVTPLAINDNDDMVGYITLTNSSGALLYGNTRAWFYINGVATNLSTAPGTTNSTANAVNNHGESVGWYQSMSGKVYAFYATNGVITNLNVPATDFLSAQNRWNGAAAINDAGLILGSTNSTTPRSWLMSGGSLSNVPTLYGTALDVTLAGALNQSGAAAITGGTNSLYRRACLVTNGVIQELPITGKASYAFGINDSNQIVGYTLPTNGAYLPQAFFFNGSTVSTIPDLSTTNFSQAFAINNDEQIIGFGHIVNGSGVAEPVQFVYNPVNGLIDINQSLTASPGWTNITVIGINGPGKIIGQGMTNGQLHGCLLTPLLYFNPSSVRYHKPTGTFTFNVSGLNGTTIVIEASCDSIFWEPIFTNVVSRGSTEFTDPDTSTCLSRYYRAVLLE